MCPQGPSPEHRCQANLRMIPSVSPEADRELTDGAVYYAREANADLGLAFIAEIERALGLLCTHSELGVLWHRNRGV